jgi:phenylalanyl-tRNA synthetase alpha chain
MMTASSLTKLLLRRRQASITTSSTARRGGGHNNVWSFGTQTANRGIATMTTLINVKKKETEKVRKSFFRCSSSSKSSSSSSLLNLDDPFCNTPPQIAERALMTPKLYQIPPHPLHTIQEKIHDYFGPDFTTIDSLSPVVSTHANFDSLLIPPDHVSRSTSDTYYLNKDTCLRTHTSAHQVELLLQQGHTQFLCTGDVYRRDDIDKSHYPIFHQMEGVKVFDTNVTTCSDVVLEDLQHTLEGLAKHLFGPVECRWVDEYFPFTHPSVELEILYRGEWMEVLGCGVMRPEIHQLENNQQAWAFGLGLERLAMILFDIPDIRLFWSEDPRFWNQFEAGSLTTFQPYSKFPPCYKDVSFWIIDGDKYDSQDVLDLTRQVAGDMVETVEVIDDFTHPKTNLQSLCFRITYRSMDRSLTNAEIDVLQEELRSKLQNELPIELR